MLHRQSTLRTKPGHHSPAGLFFLTVALLGSLQSGCAHSRGKTAWANPTLETTTANRGLRARFFGATTILFEDDTHAFLIDGFFSRPGLSGYVRGFAPREDRIHQRLSEAGVSSLDAVIVAHSHHDHALDAATIAQPRTETIIYGSHNTAEIARRQAFPRDRMIEVNDGYVLPLGKFEITFIQTPHSRNPWFIKLLNWLTIFPGVREFQYDANYALSIRHGETRMLVVPSAGLPSKAPSKADIVFLSIAFLFPKEKPGLLDEYWQTYVKQTEAKLVVPIHWDNLFVFPESALQGTPEFIDDLAETLRRLREIEVGPPVIAFMPFGKSVSFDGREIREGKVRLKQD